MTEKFTHPREDSMVLVWIHMVPSTVQVLNTVIRMVLNTVMRMVLVTVPILVQCMLTMGMITGMTGLTDPTRVGVPERRGSEPHSSSRISRIFSLLMVGHNQSGVFDVVFSECQLR